LCTGALGVVQHVGGALQIGLRPQPRGVALFGKFRPRAAEHRDADRGQFDDAIDPFQ
jgi:hypothetical protein